MMRNGDLLLFLMGSAASLAAAPLLAQEEARQQVSLPEQPLGASLRKVATQFGRNLSVSSDLVVGRTAPAIEGRYGFEEAVTRLLRGSGLVSLPVGRGLVVRRAG